MPSEGSSFKGFSFELFLKFYLSLKSDLSLTTLGFF